MEKNIQTLLFSSLVSLREQRLVGFDKTPAGEKQFEDAAAKIEQSIEDPSKLTPELIGQIAELKVKSIGDTKRNERVDGLTKLNDQKNQLLSKLPEIEKRTAADNPEWQKIQKNLTSPDAALKAEAVTAAVRLIADARAEMEGLANNLNLSDPSLKPLIKVRVKLIAALNKTIENVQAADPENKIALVPAATGGVEAQNALKALETGGRDFISGPFDVLLQNFEKAKGPDAKRIAKEKIDEAVLARRQDIYNDMVAVNAVRPPYVNIEKQIAELLKQLKQLNDAVASVTPAPTAAAEAAAKGPVAPAGAPKATAEAAGKSVAATAEVPAPDADKALADKGIEAKKVEALTGAKDDVAAGKALEDLNKDVKVEAALKNPADTKIVVDALNKKLEAVGSTKRVEAKEGKLVIKEASVVAKEAATKSVLDAKPEDSKETKDLKGFFKAILDFITELAAKLGMSPRELITGQADPAKLNAKNTPTQGLKAAEEAETKQAEQNSRLAREAAARGKNAPTPAARKQAETEQEKFQKKADAQLRNAGRLKKEADKAEDIDVEVDQRVGRLREEANKRGVPADIEAAPNKRGVVIRAKGGVNPNTLRSFAGEFQRELGADRVTFSNNTFIINVMPNNSGNVQNQIAGRDGVQIQGGKAPEVVAPAQAPRAKEVVPPTPAPSVKEEAAERPIVIKKVKGRPTGNLQ